ncbi:MAG TPA: mannose-6-phosphate isomerase, class I [Rectinemataceae bacterium]|nr:mannose-6-phosphate isomerase, class I [Rectinemataceae bacterium]
MRIHRLENPVQRYAWGSVDGITQVLGIPNPGGGPLAEIWMGAHPKAPSLALDPSGPRSLGELIAADPAAALGASALRRFGPALPFLFKVLSAGTPLSIQAHPGKLKAERGFERENLEGIPLEASERSYRDPNHKPEMAVALTPFELLCGFRPASEIARNLRLAVPELLGRQLERLESNPGRVELSVFFYSLISMEERARKLMLESARRRIEELLDRGEVPGGEEESYRWVPRIMDSFPGDIGALTPLILNLVRLQPGEAVFVAPGELHAHLSGTCLEIMANSDNVIRGALTRKHVDLPELISVLSFNPERLAVLHSEPAGSGEERFPAPAPDFRLSRISLSEGRRHERSDSGPAILLCTEGAFRLECPGEETLELRRGESVFVEAAAGTYRLTGEKSGGADQAVLYKAWLPEDRGGTAT